MLEGLRSASLGIVLIVLVGVGLVSQASAGVLAGNPNAYFDGTTTWTGSSTFTQGTLVGYVDWAVFAPGQVPQSLLNSGYTPTPNELTYAYQVFETGAAPLSTFSVALTNEADNIGAFTALSGGAPTSALLTALSSARWTFSGVVQGTSTEGVAFSSSQVPLSLFGVAVDTGQSQYVVPLPSPSAIAIPEPTSLLMAFGLTCGLSLARRRRGL